MASFFFFKPVSFFLYIHFLHIYIDIDEGFCLIFLFNGVLCCHGIVDCEMWFFFRWVCWFVYIK